MNRYGRPKYFIVIALVCLVTGILFIKAKSNEIRNKSELLEFLMDGENRLTKIDSMEWINYALTYWPHELVNAHTKGNFPKGVYFLLQCSKQGEDFLAKPGSGVNFEKAVKAISFNLSDNICLIADGNDTLKLAYSVFAPYYGIGNSTNVLLYFEDTAAQTKYEIQVSDFIHNTGDRLRFKFNLNDIKACPKLID